MAGPKPEYSSTALQYGDDTNYGAQGDAYDGTSLKVSPSLSIIKQGLTRPGKQVAAQWFNWLGNQWKGVLNALITHTAELEAGDAEIWAYYRQIPALNFSTKPVTGVMNFAFFNNVYNAWIICGDNEVAAETLNWGESVTASIVAAAGSGENCLHGDSDPSGNTVIATATRYVFNRTKATNLVTRVDALGSAATLNEALVAYDSVRAKWVWFGRAVGTGYMKTSSDRTTWTNSAASPLFYNDGTFTKRMAANPTSGRILFVSYNNSPETIYVYRTDNAGTSWAETNIPLVTLAGPEDVSLVYNVDGTWLLCASRSSNLQYTRIWRSTDDGITWTQVTALANTYFTSFAAINELWVALAKTSPYTFLHELYWSSDRGVTWTKSGQVFDTARGVFGAAGGFIVISSLGSAYFSRRYGAPALGVAT